MSFFEFARVHRQLTNIEILLEVVDSPLTRRVVCLIHNS
jgi:hypothetical protein